MKVALYIFVLLLVVVISLGIRARQHRKPPVARADPKVYFGLRDMILHGSRSKFGIPPGSRPDEPYAVVMDWGVDRGTATVVAIADGTGSVYLSSGGGFLGGGQSHESIRTAVKKTVELAAQVQPMMRLTTSYPLPQRGEVTFYVLTDAGVFTAGASEEQMRTHTSPLYQLGDSAQVIITEYRLMQQGR